MFLRKAALRPVPRFAMVDEQALLALESTLDDDEERLQESLDNAYREMELRQPSLAQWISDELAAGEDELSQSVGYFLAVAVYISFREAFPRRLAEVDHGSLQMAIETLSADEALRAEDPSEVLDSDDVVALGQPALVEFVQHHLEEALSQAGQEANLEELDRVYRAILVAVISLSHAVRDPNDPSGEGPATN